MQNWQKDIVKAQKGDLNAFDHVVKRFRDMAVGYAYAILGDFQLAEDVAQEAFIQAYQDLPKLNIIKAFPSWFRRIVFKYCDRHIRKKRPPAALAHPDVSLLSGPGQAALERFDRGSILTYQKNKNDCRYPKARAG